MLKRLLFFAALPLFFLFVPPAIEDGMRLTAGRQFASAKAAFDRQDYFLAQRLAEAARRNAPDAAAPWLLIGHCFYLQDQDPAALYHYSVALQMDPHIGHLPPFLEELRKNGPAPRTALALAPPQLDSLRRKIGQMIMVSVPGTSLSGQKRMMLKAGWIGGVILFTQNVKTRKQLARYVSDLQRTAPTPLFVAIDQEGGAVRRLREAQGFSRLPSLAALGRTKDPRLAYRFGVLSGRQLKAVGANLNLAPVVDLDHGAADPIIAKYHRSLGSDPELVAGMALKIVQGMRAQDIIATAKHFPTQSVATVNTHEAVAETDVPLERLEEEDLVPYRRLIDKGVLDAVMLSHVVYKDLDPDLPASLSAPVIQGVLRRRLGFKGLVISDDLKMDAVKQRFPLEVSVVQAVNAGVDVLLVTDNYERRVMESLVKAVEEGRVSSASIDDAYKRIIAMKVKYRIIRHTKKSPALAKGPSEKGQKLAAIPF